MIIYLKACKVIGLKEAMGRMGKGKIKRKPKRGMWKIMPKLDEFENGICDIKSQLKLHAKKKKKKCNSRN